MPDSFFGDGCGGGVVHSAFGNLQVMTERILRTLDNPHVDILAHPTTKFLTIVREIEADWDRILYRPLKHRRR